VITNPARASSSPSPTARDTPQQLCTFTRTHLCTSSRTPTLTERQCTQLEFIAKAHPVLHRAYLLKEALRLALKVSIQKVVIEFAV
jgi:hypothetical protein